MVALVDDINRQSAGTHILVIGYSLGANNAILVANNTNYIDSIIALQPSIFTSNTGLTGNVGRIVEIYNPNPWMTFGGMGSQKLMGANIEYIVNNDSHLGAPFNSEFRTLVKSEIARLSAELTPNTAQQKTHQYSHSRLCTEPLTLCTARSLCTALPLAFEMCSFFKVGCRSESLTWACPHSNGRAPRSQEDPVASEQSSSRAG